MLAINIAVLAVEIGQNILVPKNTTVSNTNADKFSQGNMVVGDVNVEHYFFPKSFSAMHI